MNSVFKCLAVGGMSVVFAACSGSKNSDIPEPGSQQQNPGVQNFSTMTSQEVLQAKYEKAVLTCKTWMAYAHDLTKEGAPNDTFFLDLLNPNEAGKQLQLHSKVSGQDFTFTLQIKDIRIVDVELRALEGLTYQLKYSPEVSFAYSYDDEISDSTGTVVGGGKGAGENKFFEKVPDRTLNMTHSVAGDSNKYLTDVDCFLDTVAKAPYQDQFSVSK